MHLPQIISDLALILMVAGLFAVVFRKLRQPVVLGYLIAGLCVGPQLDIFPTVGDPENIKAWAELGVIFFLFLLGMEFSFKKLIGIGRPATIAALVEVLGVIVIGFLVGRAFGWSTTESLYFGAILSISSTAIVIKTIEEFAIKAQYFASLVFGILIVQDLLAIVLLVFFSTLAINREFEGVSFGIQVGKLLAFLIIMIPLGIRLMPKFLHKLRPYLNDETRVVLALGLCLSLVMLASSAGLSAALGAFLMGAFMAESPEGERIERFLKPIKDLFGAIFFTSVGMLVNFQQVYDHWLMVCIMVLITVVGKTVMTYAGMKLARQETSVALQTSFSLAQIGEFSFIIATLGLSFGVIQSEMYSMTVATAVITTFSTPYMIRFGMSPQFSAWKKQISKSRSKEVPHLWNGHVVEMEVHPHFVNLGRTLEEMHLRETFGVSIVAIIRGEMRLDAPSRYDRMMAYDRIIALGTDAQLRRFEKHMRSERHSMQEIESTPYELKKIVIPSHSHLIGKSLRQSGIREEVNGIIFGIEREDEKFLNPDSTFVLRPDDILWIYGQKHRIRALEA
jgi:CPA2 family monovalent cation:H+ antiporter-2